MRRGLALALLALMMALSGCCSLLPGQLRTRVPAGWIAFTSFRDAGYQIYVMRTDGSGVTQLTYGPGYNTEPTWSPDGRRIAFVSTRDGPLETDIYIMNADGSGQTRLTNAPGDDDEPDWSPDGAQIAFVSQRDGNPEIYVMDADGTNQSRLTHNPEYDQSPTWSPDGARIAFVAEHDNRLDLYAVARDGSGLAPLKEILGGEAYPDWSPDGGKIAFTTGLRGKTCILDISDSTITCLTNDERGDGCPSWSPDGKWLAFESEASIDGLPRIYVTDGDGKRTVVVSRGRSISMDPSWAPLGYEGPRVR